MTHPYDWIEPYVDGDLPAEDARALESHLASCDSCRRDLEGLRTLVGRARSLPRSIEPPKDHWPAVRQKIQRPPRAPWLLAVAGVAGLAAAAGFALIAGAGVLAWLASGTDVGPMVAQGDAALHDGRLPDAEAHYADAIGADPSDRPALEGASYTALLRGDYDESDRLLRLVGDDPDTLLRRALVAHAKGDLDAVRDLGLRSGLPTGQVLAAEVHLADAEGVKARQLLAPLANESGQVGEAARAYLAMLTSEDPAAQQHAELTALWALGKRQVACDSAVEVIPALQSSDDRNLYALVWAGRAVTSGDPDGAEVLLDAIDLPPIDQAWRVYATRGMVQIARGQNDAGVATFEALASAGAPGDGLSDALVTAAALTRDPAVAERLAGSVEGVAASRALQAAGSPTWASAAPHDGAYGAYARGQ